MEKLAQEDHPCRLSYQENERYQKHWYLTLNKSGKNAPMRLRSEFRTAVTLMNRLHRESGEERAEPIPFQQYQRWHPSSHIHSSLTGGSGIKTFFFFLRKTLKRRKDSSVGSLLQQLDTQSGCQPTG